MAKAPSVPTEPSVPAKEICGIIMPISAIDGCSESHWNDVLEIISSTIESAGFEPNIVSSAEEVGIIQKRIIQNLYDNPIVVCDVSGKNPNVMFELGMRLAFDRPVVILKDDKTSYSFDPSPIEHLTYPRDLRFSKIVEFKEKLKAKIEATYRAGTKENYTTFLKHFGEFKVAKLDTREVSRDEYILDELKMLRASIARIESPEKRNAIRRASEPLYNYEFLIDCKPLPSHDSLANKFLSLKGVTAMSTRANGDGRLRVLLRVAGELSGKEVTEIMNTAFPGAKLEISRGEFAD